MCHRLYTLLYDATNGHSYITFLVADDGGIVSMAAALCIIIHHPAIVTALKYGTLVAVAAETVHHDWAGPWSVVGILDWLSVLEAERLAQHSSVTGGPENIERFLLNYTYLPSTDCGQEFFNL